MKRLLFAGLLAGLLSFAWTFSTASSRPSSLPVILGAHLLAGVLAAWLLSLASLGRFGARMGFVLLLSIFAALAAFGIQWSSGQAAAIPAALLAGRLIAGWMLGGLLLAWRLSPPPPRETVELRGAPLGRDRQPNR